jgi:hypothetical protein
LTQIFEKKFRNFENTKKISETISKFRKPTLPIMNVSIKSSKSENELKQQERNFGFYNQEKQKQNQNESK